MIRSLSLFGQYAMLTGAYPFPEECADATVQQYVKLGKTPFIDPRWKDNSYAEGELVKVIEDCWAYKAEDRPTISELVIRLRKAVDENRRRQSQ